MYRQIFLKTAPDTVCRFAVFYMGASVCSYLTGDTLDNIPSLIASIVMDLGLLFFAVHKQFTH